MRSRLVRAIVIGFSLALLAWAVTFLAFAIPNASLDVIARTVRPGGALVTWFFGIPGHPYESAGARLVAEFIANWSLYAGLTLAVNLLINALHRTVPVK